MAQLPNKDIKPKRLTDEEQNYVREAILRGEKDAEIAEKLGRNEATIRTIRARMGFIGVQKTKDITDVTGSKNMTGKEKKASLEYLFKLTPRYKRLAKQFVPDDLDSFMDIWVDYLIQFEDLKSSEEEILELMITSKLRIDDNRKHYKDAVLAENDLKKKLKGRGEMQLDLENEEDRFIFELVENNNRIQQELNKDYNALTDKHEKYVRMMNGTREQREMQNRVGGDNFFSLIRACNERDKRADMGLYNERMKKSIENKKEQFKKPHRFADGDVHPVLMDGADYHDKKVTTETGQSNEAVKEEVKPEESKENTNENNESQS